MPLLDEHGSASGEVPGFVTPDTLERWLVCALIGIQATGLPDGHPEQAMFATELFRADIPLGDVEEGIGDELLQEAREWREAWVRRDRRGQFADKPDLPRLSMPAPPASPGVSVSQQQIADAGLDKWPEPGPAAKKLLGTSRNTAEMYALQQPASPGVLQAVPYNAERSKLHDAIVASFFEGKRPPPVQPHAVFTAGGPASGKSTALEHNPTLLPEPEHTVHVDPDAIKEQLPEYQQLRADNDRYAALAVHLESGDIAARVMVEAMERGLHVVIDGTGNSDPGEFTSKLEMARDRGYSVDVLYVNAPTDTAVAWSIKRASETGRHVPVPVIRDQHMKVSRNFANEVAGLGWLNALDIIDRGDHIATWQDGTLRILNQQRFAAFVAKQNETPRG